MEKKIIFFDIDGTLVEEGKNYVYPSNITAIRQAQANGHLCFINTGRPVSSIADSLKEIGFDGMICGCGTYIEYQGKELLYHHLDPKRVKEIMQWCEDKDFDLFFEGRYGILLPRITKGKIGAEFKEYFLGSETIKSKEYDPYGEEEYYTDKMMVKYYSGEDLDDLAKFLEKDFDIIDRGENMWEIVPKHYSKASGIDEIISYLDMELKDTVSIGDSTNDVPMLEHTGISVLMGNGTEFLKEMVTYVTDTLENDGVMKALQHFGIVS